MHSNKIIFLNSNSGLLAVEAAARMWVSRAPHNTVSRVLSQALRRPMFPADL